MKVKDLIAELQKLPSDMIVLVDSEYDLFEPLLEVNEVVNQGTMYQYTNGLYREWLRGKEIINVCTINCN